MGTCKNSRPYQQMITAWLAKAVRLCVAWRWKHGKAKTEKAKTYFLENIGENKKVKFNNFLATINCILNQFGL